MSSGSYNVGSLPYTSYVEGVGNLAYPGPIGYTSAKSWSGADRVKAEKVFISVPRINPKWKGANDTRNVKWLWKQKRWHFAEQKTPPSDEHAYSCSWDKTIAPAGWWTRDIDLNGQIDGSGWGSPASMGAIFNPASNPSAWSSDDDIALILKLRTKITGVDFHAGIALAEIDKTAAMIANHARIIARVGKLVRRGQIQNALKELVSYRRSAGLMDYKKAGVRAVDYKGTVRTVASKHLELVYGVVPLIADVYTGAQYIAHHTNVPRQQIYRASRERRVVNDPWYFLAGQYTPSHILGRQPKKSYWGVKKSIKLIVTEVDPVKLSGLTDYRSVVWERIPFSFVFDWFIPVGQWLEALNFSSAVAGTYVTSTKDHWWWTGVTGSNLRTTWGFPDTLGMYHGSFTRVVSSSPQISLPTFKPWGRIASLTHAANAVSLLITGAAARKY